MTIEVLALMCMPISFRLTNAYGRQGLVVTLPEQSNALLAKNKYRFSTVPLITVLGSRAQVALMSKASVYSADRN